MRMWNENGGWGGYQCWRHSQLDGMSNEDDNGGMTANRNKD